MVVNQQTQDAAEDVLTSPDFDGKIVVMTWEHKHIANQVLEESIVLDAVG